MAAGLALPGDRLQEGHRRGPSTRRLGAGSDTVKGNRSGYCHSARYPPGLGGAHHVLPRRRAARSSPRNDPVHLHARLCSTTVGSDTEPIPITETGYEKLAGYAAGPCHKVMRDVGQIICIVPYRSQYIMLNIDLRPPCQPRPFGCLGVTAADEKSALEFGLDALPEDRAFRADVGLGAVTDPPCIPTVMTTSVVFHGLGPWSTWAVFSTSIVARRDPGRRAVSIKAGTSSANVCSTVSAGRV